MTLHHLGQQSSAPISELDRIPWRSGDVVINLDCTEFTSYCPVTGQPDFARLHITYWPVDWLVETKSLKLWLQGFRDRAAFNEVLVAEIATMFAEQIMPSAVRVTGVFHIRGGIAVTATAERGEDV